MKLICNECLKLIEENPSYYQTKTYHYKCLTMKKGRSRGLSIKQYQEWISQQSRKEKV